jgi:hypothetical protein
LGGNVLGRKRWRRFPSQLRGLSTDELESRS